jgi:hypothetical protein
MTALTVNTLPLDDNEAAVLGQIVWWRLNEILDESSPDADAAELDRWSEGFTHFAEVLRMIDNRPAAVDTRMLGELREHEAEHVDSLGQLQTALRELCAGDNPSYVGRTLEERIERDQQTIRRYEEHLATCRRLLRRCEEGGEA